MVRDIGSSKVNKPSSSETDSVLGRGGSGSSNLNHMDNLQEDQNLLTAKKASVYPPGSRFLPTHLGLVRIHLKNMVINNKRGFITTLDVYNTDPWLLAHVNNDLFKRNEWYYFVPRTKRGGKRPKRTVPGRGGGTWKSTTGKEPIKDKDKKVEGYRQNLTYYKEDVKGKVVSTGWVMTEYCLHDDVHDDLVLCHIRRENKKKVKDGFVEEVPQVQEEEEEEESFEAYAKRIETMMLQGGHGQQREIYYLPPEQSDDDDMMMMWLNQGQEQHQLDNFGFDGAENLMFDMDELLTREDDVTHTNGILDVEADATQAQDDV